MRIYNHRIQSKWIKQKQLDFSAMKNNAGSLDFENDTTQSDQGLKQSLIRKKSKENFMRIYFRGPTAANSVAKNFDFAAPYANISSPRKP